MPKFTDITYPVADDLENAIIPIVQDGQNKQAPSALFGGGGGTPPCYDLIIRSQAEFESLIADPTWFDAQSVAFVGQFTLSTPDNSGVKRPANVTRIDGYNNAKITVTNFKYNSTTAQGGLWDDEKTNNPHCYINDLTIDCTGTSDGDSYGCFFGNNNTYTNCTGTGTGNDTAGSNHGFSGKYNTYTNCTGTGTSKGGGYGFYGYKNTYTNCTGTGNSTGTGLSGGYGFRGNNNTYTNCTGTGTGGIYGEGYGFYGNNNRIISCTALAYLPTDHTPSNTNCVPIYNDSTSTKLFMIIRDCKFPQITKSGYQQGTIWCNIANNTTMVGSIKDNVYHSRFTVALIKGTNVVADNNSAVDITVI